jgi:hypothetical protein
MAITTTIRIQKNANAGIPSSYVPTSLPTLANATQELFSVDLAVATIENASATTALTNLATDLQTWLTATYYNSILHLDTADTISVNINVTKIERVRLEENDLLPGVEYYRVNFISYVSY